MQTPPSNIRFKISSRPAIALTGGRRPGPCQRWQCPGLAINDLGFLYFDQGKYQQSEALLRNALNDPREIKTDVWLRYSYASLLGANLAGQKKYAEAEPLLLSGYQGMLNQEATIPPWGHSALEQGGSRIVQLYEAWGKPQKAAEWRQKLQLPSKETRDR
jgi:tetratricopeptide (TPR) repeat protein